MDRSVEADSESTSIDDDNTENFCDNPTRDTLAEGLLLLFKPAVDQLDERVKATRESQVELNKLLDHLLEEVKKIQEQQQSPVDLDSYLKKLINVKHKVTVVTNVLQGTQDRLTKIHQQIEREKLRRRTLLDAELPTSFPHLSLDHSTSSSTQ